MDGTTRVALLQLPAFPVEDAAASLEHTLRRIDDAAAHRPDIIALPEVTWPGYFIGATDLAARGLPPASAAAARIAAKAREHHVLIAAGLALERPGGGLTNAAALLGRDGALVGRYDKAFLWHFDHRWFAPGDAYPVFDTDAGRIGMLICADGRMPEIARALALGGAQIILDLTAWVSTGRTAAALTTTQVTHLMRCRAFENGVWIACADKTGVEAASIVYAGRSCVIDPAGEVRAALGPDEEATLLYDIPLADPAPPVARRPELYEALGQPTASLPVLRTVAGAVVVPAEERRVAVVQMPIPADPARFVEAAREIVHRQALMDSALILFPAPPPKLAQAYTRDTIGEPLLRLAAEHGLCLAFAARDPARDVTTMYLAGPRGLIGEHRLTHHERGATGSAGLGDRPCPVFATPIGAVGLMAGAEGLVPEVARSLMLRGAEIILWSADDPPCSTELVARTRAEENRVFVACAAAPTRNGAALIADPSGRTLAIALEGRTLTVGAEINRALAHVKERAPGTDVVRARQPATYGIITRASTSARA